MRRALPLVLLLAGVARAGEPTCGAAAFVVDLDDDEGGGCWFPSGDPDLTPETAAVAHGIESVLASPYARVSVTTFRVHRAGGAAAAWLATDAVVLDDDARDALRTAVGAGDVVALETVRIAAAANAFRSATAGRAENLPTLYDVESDIGASTTWARSGGLVRSGLVARVAVTPHVDGRSHLRFEVVAAEPAPARVVRSAAGPLERIDLPAFAARGSALLASGETLCVRGVDPSGEGFVALLRLDTPAAPRLPADLGGDWVAVPYSALLTVTGTAALEDARFELDSAESAPAARLDLGADLETPRQDDPLLFLDDFGLVQRDIGPHGVVYARTPLGGAPALVSQAHAVLASLRTAVAAVRPAGGGALVVPFVDGDAPRIFLGRTGTRLGTLDVETGCESCIGVTHWTERDWSGLAFAALAVPGHPLDVCLAARTVRRDEWREFDVRRSLPGHATFTFDRIGFAEVEDDLLAVRSRLPDAGGALAGGVTVEVTGRDGTAVAPRALVVDGETLYVLPGGTARVRRVHRTPHVVSWEDDQSCGMTMRYPEVTLLAEGLDAALTLSDDSDELAIAATRSGAPETLRSGFDTGDAVLDVVRVPHLDVVTTVPVGAVRRVAWSGALELRAGDPASGERPRLRTLRVTAGPDAHGVRSADGADVVLDGGGTTYAPADCGDYESNHDSGEVTVETCAVADGVVLLLAPPRGGVADGTAVLRSRAAWRLFDLTKQQSIRRPDVALRLLLPTLTERTWPIAAPDELPFDRATGAASPSPARVEVVPASLSEDDE